MKPETIVILAMHRSGSSCLTGSLQAAGLYLGDVFTASPHNKKGNRESQEVMDLNTAVLRHSGGDWDDPPAQVSWTTAHQEARHFIVRTMKEGGKTPWGFKDPRFTFTLPFWREAIPRLQLVGTFRHPISVAASLAARNRWSRERSLKLWMQYNSRLLDYLDAAPFPVVCFDVAPELYLRDLEAICRSLCLEPGRSEVPFFEADLRTHQLHDSRETLPNETAAIYARLMSHYESQAER